MQGHYHELFVTHCQPHLLKKQFAPTAEQLQFARQSLIEKHKANNSIQQLLLCRKAKENQQELQSASEKTLIENERKKYMDFVRKNYNQKIAEELTSLSKLRARIKEFQTKNEEIKRMEENKKEDLNLMEEGRRKRKAEDKKVAAGKKKVKTEESKAKAKKKQANESQKAEVEIKPPSPAQPAQREDENIIEQLDELHSQSLGLDLLNSLSQDEQFDNFDQQD